MKKTYIIPEISVVALSMADGVLINNVSVNGTATMDVTTMTGGNGGDAVKADRGSRSDYNVWNDDWSK